MITFHQTHKWSEGKWKNLPFPAIWSLQLACIVAQTTPCIISFSAMKNIIFFWHLHFMKLLERQLRAPLQG
jgi:hypothetical protein